jgi:hypothetical protein
MRDESGAQVFCEEYERLLKKSLVARTSWNNGRAEIRRSGHRGRDTDDELRTLQATYAKALALLQYHEHECEVCQVMSLIKGVYSGLMQDTPPAQLTENPNGLTRRSGDRDFRRNCRVSWFGPDVGVSRRT